MLQDWEIGHQKQFVYWSNHSNCWCIWTQYCEVETKWSLANLQPLHMYRYVWRHPPFQRILVYIFDIKIQNTKCYNLETPFLTMLKGLWSFCIMTMLPDQRCHCLQIQGTGNVHKIGLRPKFSQVTSAKRIHNKSYQSALKRFPSFYHLLTSWEKWNP